MAQGTPATVPDDGLTTKQRRNRPMVIVNQGEGKGKSTAAFGLALRGWNQGWSIGVFQFVKSAKWRIGEQTALEALGKLHEETGQGGSVEWHKMGSGWSWTRKTSEDDPARAARDGWDEVKRRLADQAHGLYVLDEFTYPMEWAGSMLTRWWRRWQTGLGSSTSSSLVAAAPNRCWNWRIWSRT